jgi:hypothetical protein
MTNPLPTSPIELGHLPYAVGIKTSYCINTQKTLVMKEISFSATEDNFHHIRDTDDEDLLLFKEHGVGVDKERIFYDTNGNLLWSLKTRPSHFHRQYYGEDAVGKEIFNVHGHWHCLSPYRIRSYVISHSSSPDIFIAPFLFSCPVLYFSSILCFVSLQSPSTDK